MNPLLAGWMVAALQVQSPAAPRPACRFVLDAEASALQLDCVGRGVFHPAPLTEPEQQGYAQVQVSPTGTQVGWVARTRNCCTAYPLPTALVIHGAAGVVRRIPMVPPVWNWRFSEDGTAVAFHQSTAHGTSVETWTLQRIADGATLDQVQCFPPEPNHGVTVASLEPPGPVPAWMRPLLHERHREDPQAALDRGLCP